MAYTTTTAEGIQLAQAETEATHSSTAPAQHGGEHEAFPPFDPTYFASQLLWLAIMFGLFYWFMSRVAIPRISGILEVRRDRISGDLDEAQRLREEADAAHAAYEQELAEARNRAHAIAQEANDKAKAEADAERQKVEDELATRLAGAEAKIAKIRESALAEVGNIASDTAGAIVRELIGGTATKTEVAKAVEAAAQDRG
ncbi:MAG: F0F1 ATP synthase subunit B [Salaquimonas sp.]|jgi:F-type H+-transporting ATPase subunit b|nr:F0F1 ATP synthase subunit B [Salaquimonas sp.]